MTTFATWDPWAADVSMTNAARKTYRASGTGRHQCLEFVDAGTREAWVTGWIPEDYAGGDLNFRINWIANSVTSGAVVFDGALESHTLDADDLDVDSLGTLVTTTGVTTGSVNGEEVQSVILLDTAAELDSVAAGEKFRFRFRRQPGNGSDTLGESVLVTWLSMDWD